MKARIISNHIENPRNFSQLYIQRNLIQFDPFVISNAQKPSTILNGAPIHTMPKGSWKCPEIQIRNKSSLYIYTPIYSRRRGFSESRMYEIYSHQSPRFSLSLSSDDNDSREGSIYIYAQEARESHLATRARAIFIVEEKENADTCRASSSSSSALCIKRNNEDSHKFRGGCVKRGASERSKARGCVSFREGRFFAFLSATSARLLTAALCLRVFFLSLWNFMSLTEQRQIFS